MSREEPAAGPGMVGAQGCKALGDSPYNLLWTGVLQSQGWCICPPASEAEFAADRPSELSPEKRAAAEGASGRRGWLSPAFTLIELILVIVLLGILATFAVAQAGKAKESAKVAKAIAEVRTLTSEIDQYDAFNGSPPASLADIGRGGLVDPWGNPYVFMNFGGVVERKPSGGGPGGLAGKARKDKNLVPINSTYDLYSMGADGQTHNSINNKVSLDDIIRANDGAYIGLASGY